MDKRTLPAGIHVILGDSAAGTFRHVFDVRDQLLIDQDVLSCGPTPTCDDLTQWKQFRSEYWAKLVPSEIGQHVHSPINLVDQSHRLRDAERIVVWTATGVSEQLFIAFVLHLVRVVQADPARVSIVRFEYLPNRRARILGTGELNEENMSDHPEPVPLSRDVMSNYFDAWEALTSHEPIQIERFSEDHPTANQWLKQAMQRMLRRFPDKRSGLPYWDLKLLENVRRHGPRAVRIIGHTMGENWENGDLVGDWYLFGRLLRMSDERLPKPLLTISGDRRAMRGTEVALTSFGEAVAEGRQSNYLANPIEDWVAGVRLSSADGALWVRDGEKLVPPELPKNDQSIS
jgi:hypothetical protein